MYQNNRFMVPTMGTAPVKPQSVNYLPSNNRAPQPNLYKSDAYEITQTRGITSPTNAQYHYYSNPHSQYQHMAQQQPPNHAMPYQHYAINHTVVLPPRTIIQNSNSRQQIQNFAHTNTFQSNQEYYHQNRQINENQFAQRMYSHSSSPLEYRRQNYHMSGVLSPTMGNQHNIQYRQSQNMRHISPNQLPNTAIEQKRNLSENSHGFQQPRKLSPAYEYNPQSPMTINFSYNQQRVITQQQQPLQINQSQVQHRPQPQIYPQPQMQQQIQPQVQPHIQPQVQPQPIALPPQQTQEQIIAQTNTVVTTVTIWQHHFVEIYMRFESFVERFDIIIQEFLMIQDLFDSVNDEEGWAELRNRYSNLMERFANIREESIYVIQNNRQVVDKLSQETLQFYQERLENADQADSNPDNRQPSGSSSVGQPQMNKEPNEMEDRDDEPEEAVNWQLRYYQLSEQYTSMSKEYQSLYEELQRRITEQEQKQQQGGQGQNGRDQELQKNYNILEAEYQNLTENFNKLSYEYNQVYQQLQKYEHIEQQYQQQIMALQQQGNQISPEQQEEIQNMINQYQRQLEEAGERCEYLEAELSKKERSKPGSQGQQHNEQEHNTQYQNRIEELLEEKNILINTINEMREELNKNEKQLEEYSKKTSQIHGQNAQELELQLEKYVKQLHNKNQYIEELTVSIQNLQGQLEQQTHDNYLAEQTQHSELITQIEVLRSKISNYERTIEFKTKEIEQIERRMSLNEKQYNEAIEESRRRQKEYKREKMQTSRAFSIKDDAHLYNKIHELQQKLATRELEMDTIHEEHRIVVNETKNSQLKKITSLEEELRETQEAKEKLIRDRQKAINKIKEYFYEQSASYEKKITEKDDIIRVLNEKIRAFEKQLANRNMEISRFRYQVNSGLASTNTNTEEVRKLSETLQRKNNQLQQFKRSLEQKILTIKELQQKITSFQQQFNDKVFQNNNLKREVFEIHNCKAEISSLNSSLKKKNQEINELRISSLQKDQLQLTIDSLQRQKIRNVEYLKEKDREIQAKSHKIGQLQKKLNQIILENGKTPSSPTHLHSSFSTNYENLLKQKQSDNKKLQYEIEVQEISLQSKEKTIRDLNEKMSTIQQSFSLLKAQSQNKYSKLQAINKQLQKRFYDLQSQHAQIKHKKQVLETKARSFEKSQEDGLKLFDKEIKTTKTKLSQLEEKYTQVLTEYELFKNSTKIIEQENAQLKMKIDGLNERIDEKNQIIESIKMNALKEGRDMQQELDKRREDIEEKLSKQKIRSKSLEEEMKKLENRLKQVQLERRSYKERLFTEHNHSQQIIENRYYTQQASDLHNQHMTRISEGFEKFKLKDPEANDVFERKVIYDLKKENQLLRRELSGLGTSSFSMVNNRMETMNNQQSIYEAMTDRQNHIQEHRQTEDQALQFHKTKNKELEQRIEQLLTMNKSLKDKLASFGQSGQLPQETIQFYKSEVQSLELLNKNLSNKHAVLINQNYILKEEQLEYQSEVKNLKGQIIDLEGQIREYKNKNRQKQQLERELEGLKDLLKQEKEEAASLYSKYKTRQEELNSELTKQRNKNTTLTSQLERFKQQSKISEQAHEDKMGSAEQQLEYLRETVRSQSEKITELQSRIWQLQSAQEGHPDRSYEIERIRNSFLELQALIDELRIVKGRHQQDQKVIVHMKKQIQASLQVVSILGV